VRNIRLALPSYTISPLLTCNTPYIANI